MVVGEASAPSTPGAEEGAVGGAVTNGCPPPPTPAAPAPAPTSAVTPARSGQLGPTSNIHNIMGGMESTAGVKLHNHRRKLRQRFDIIRKLGQGTYGKVQLGINKETGQEVAIKTIKKAKIETEADLIRIRREIQIMSSVQHPNIIHIYEVFENREKMVLVMEYAAGGELYDYLSERKVLTETEARRIFRQISTAVYYCHKHKICHRDLKLENILLDETGNAKIADFGLSNVFDEQRLLSTFCGSPLYASPEIVKGTPYHGPEVDCWSLGVLLYTLVYGAMPFDGSNFKKLVKQISQGDYFEPKKPSPASPLVRDMLTVNPRKRADIERICAHWWVNETYNESCLEMAEHLANQTPVRLDLLLSLAPPPPPAGSEKLLLSEGKEEANSSGMPARDNFPRSHSVGSLMELDYPSRKTSPPRLPVPPPPSSQPPPLSPLSAAEEEAKKDVAPKRKLQECASGETGAKRKEVDLKKKVVENKRKEESMEVDEGMDKEQQGKQVAKPIKEKRKSIKGKKDSSAKVEEKVKEVTEVTASKESVVTPEVAEPQLSEADVKSAKVKRKKKVDSKSESEPSSEPATPLASSETPASPLRASSVTPTSAIVAPPLPVATTLASPVTTTPSVTPSPVTPSSLVTLSSSTTPTPSVTPLMVQSPSATPLTSVTSMSSATPTATPSPSTTASTQSLEQQAAEVPKETSKEVKKEEVSKIPAETTVVKRRPQSLKCRTRTEELAKLDSASPEKSSSSTPDDSAPPPRTEMRRRSSIMDRAEKFNSMSSTNLDSNKHSASPEKPKKVYIPGVKVSDFKKAFETKTVPSSKSASTIKASTEEPKKESISPPKLKPFSKSESPKVEKKEEEPKLIAPLKPMANKSMPKEADVKKLKEVPVPKATEKVPEAPKSEPIAVEPSPPINPPAALIKQESPVLQPSPVVPQLPVNEIPEVPKPVVEVEPKKKSTTMKIVLDTGPQKSATLPRRTSKAEIRLNNPASVVPPPVKTEFRTEVEHMVSPPPTNVQRSEVAFPVAAATATTLPRQPRPYQPSNTAPIAGAFRSSSVEPDPNRVRERIIPIRMEGDEQRQSPPVRPPAHPSPLQHNKVAPTQSRESLSRQSTIESEPETIRGEPIRKSPREFIIPIAVEGGGYITPRAGSLEPSDSVPSTPTRGRPSRFSSRPKRMGLLSESGDNDEDVSHGPPAFPTLLRHTSVGRDGEHDDEGGPLGRGMGGFHMHSLRSSRPTRTPVEHTDSFSSAEEEEDDEDGFEILTAESLFSTLLSRVRNLTQRLNVEEMRPGFGSSRLLGHMPPPFSTQPHSLFSNFHSRAGVEPLSRRVSESSRFGRSMSRGEDFPWRRSLSRDASEGDSVYSEHHPRGEGDGSANSEYTPSLSRRMHHAEAYRRSISSDVEAMNRGHPQRHHHAPPHGSMHHPEMERMAGVYGTLRQPRRSQDPLKLQEAMDPRQQALRNRSLSLNRENNNWRRSSRSTPERSVLGKFLQEEGHEQSPPLAPPPLTHMERRRGRRVSRFLRPDFYDTPREESLYVKQKEDEEKARKEERMKQRTLKNVERRLDKVRTEDEDSSTSPSRVGRAINSLQQRNQKQSEYTESSLLKRAVSSDDCVQYSDSPKGKVTSVLGMFKKMEKQPVDKNNALSRFRRAHSVNDGSNNDSTTNGHDNLRKKNLRGDGSNLKIDVGQRSAFTAYAPRTPSEEPSFSTQDGEDEDDDWSQQSRRQDSSSGGRPDDSWDSLSMCSDSLEPLEDETVQDRIRRKSFYTRFNDVPATPRKAPKTASPAVAAILERDLTKRPHHHHHHHHRHHREGHREGHQEGNREAHHRELVDEGQHNGTHHHRRNTDEILLNNGSGEQVRHGRRQQQAYSMYNSLPRGWEPQTEAAFYQASAAAPVSQHRYGGQPGGPLYSPYASTEGGGGSSSSPSTRKTSNRPAHTPPLRVDH